MKSSSLCALEEYDQALEAVNQGLEKTENYYLLLLQKAYILFHKKKYKDACQITEQLIKTHREEPLVWIIHATSLFGLGQYEEEKRAINQAISLHSKDKSPKIDYYLANYYSTVNDNVNALIYLEKAITKRPAYRHLAKRDVDLKSIFSNKDYKKIIQ